MHIAVYCGSVSGNQEIYTEKTALFGRWMAEQGHVLIYGGAQGGLMGAVSNAVLENGGKVIGIIPDFLLHCEQGHEGLHTLEVVHSMSTRKSRMIELGDAFIAMPGGIGTLEEITEVLTLKRLGRTEKRAFLYNINGYYEPLRSTFRQMVEKEFLPEEEMKLFEFVANVDELDEALRG